VFAAAGQAAHGMAELRLLYALVDLGSVAVEELELAAERSSVGISARMKL
jgi:hypothetical protein